MRFVKVFSIVLVLAMVLPFIASAEEKFGWLDISGDYRARLDSLKGEVHTFYQFNPFNPFAPPALVDDYDVKNDLLMTNRVRLNIKAKATENIQFKTRLVMYKTWGEQDADSVNAGFFGDRTFVFDGTVGHLPQDNVLRVDTAYATWSNILDLPVWFSIGRRPSTGGVPTNIRRNEEKVGTAGVPGLLVDYAFDGGTIGWAPYIEALPGAYAKICYGRGNDTGYRDDRPGTSNPKDTDFVGINVVPYSTDDLHIELQWDRGNNIFDDPNDSRTNLGDIDHYGGVVMGKIGTLNLFASGAISRSNPNSNAFFLPVDSNADGLINELDSAIPLANLLNDCDPSTGICSTDDHTGHAIYVGARYDIEKTGTKIGAEYNYGSKYWITFAPAADDMWTSKLGTRGSVYEAYLIQEIPDPPISKRGKAYFRLGYQYYDFEYTGSNNWVGKPKKIDDLDSSPFLAQLQPPLENAHDIYLTFNVTF